MPDYSIDPPGTSTNTVSGTNAIITSASVPANFDATGTNHAKPGTIFGYLLSVQLRNSAGQPATNLAGLAVYESKDGGTTYKPMNVNVATNGTYPDWVGWCEWLGQDWDTTDPDYASKAGSFTNAPSGFYPPMANQVLPQDYKIKVGTNVIPGTLKRKVTVINPSGTSGSSTNVSIQVDPIP